MNQKRNIDLLKKEDKYKLISAIDQASVTIVMTDIKGNIKYCNETFEKVSGYTLEEIMDQNSRILKSGFTADEVFKNMWDTILSGDNWKGELINKKKDGNIYYEEVRITPIKDENGKIVNFLAIKQDISQRKYLEERLKQTSIRDPLTNLYNRRYVLEQLKKNIEVFKKSGEKFAVGIIDIDFFKVINDTYGHQVGDFVLKEFSEILVSSIRTYDILGRYGGEEFIIIFQGIDKSTSQKIINRIAKNLKISHLEYDKNKIELTFSCGIADINEIDKEKISTSNIIYLADERLYKAKNSGRNKIIIK